ncbi:MAG: aspartate-semialdehyde dehydrogenase, partial [Nitrospira sp.]|nr:aspartate-semialdehyde dehydrogenase [Nitrospira sp.]
RSEGLTVEFQGQEIPVKVLKPDAFAGVDVALFSAGAGVSKEYGPLAVKAGAVV